MMRRDAVAVANAVRMRQAHPSRRPASLLVEGDTNSRLYKNMLGEGTFDFENACGKESVLVALALLEKDRKYKVLAIVDADFDVLDDIPSPSRNCLRTDAHDAETMIMQSPALEKILREFGSEDKINKFVKRKPIRDALLECGALIGYLRLFSQRRKLNLKFQDVRFNKFLNAETLQIDLSKLIQAVKDNSQKQNVPIDNKDVEALKDSKHDLWHVCCGHDLAELLAVALRKAIGSAKEQEVKAEKIEQALRLAYEKADFEKTRLFQSIADWKKRQGITMEKPPLK